MMAIVSALRSGVSDHNGQKLAYIRHQLIFYRCVASVTARWAAIRWTAGVGDHVINRRMTVGDAMMVLGRGQCREGSADQQSAEKKYSSDRHGALLRARTIPSRPQCSLPNDSRRRLAQLRAMRRGGSLPISPSCLTCCASAHGTQCWRNGSSAACWGAGVSVATSGPEEFLLIDQF